MVSVERILANNSGPFTGTGTNTWLIDDASGEVAVIDPGPLDKAHETAIVERLGTRHAAAVIVTHTHPDHAPLANPLARELGVPALGYSSGPGFIPDERLHEGSVIEVGRARIRVIHTPGHSGDHLCFRVGDVLFSGDHIMGGSSVMVEEMGPYLRSLERLRGVGLRRIYPGHGEDMDRPDEVIDWYLAHRRQRHEEIYEAIVRGAGSVADIVTVVYAEVDPSLHPMAALSVEAHLGLLLAEGRIALQGETIVSRPPPQDQ
jgi:glyoxylase-like metal-dependent hydrolase (beta-lactamase superfamily II)